MPADRLNADEMARCHPSGDSPGGHPCDAPPRPSHDLLGVLLFVGSVLLACVGLIVARWLRL